MRELAALVIVFLLVLVVTSRPLKNEIIEMRPDASKQESMQATTKKEMESPPPVAQEKNEDEEKGKKEEKAKTEKETSSEEEAKKEIEKKEEQVVSKVLKETFIFDNLEITLDDDITFTVINEPFKEYDGETVARIPVTLKNMTSEVQGFNSYYMHVYDSMGQELDLVGEYFPDSLEGSYKKLEPKEQSEFALYILYKRDGVHTWSLNNYIQRNEVKVNLKKPSVN